MSLPRLPVVMDLKTVTAVRNGGAGRAEPYVLSVFFSVDGRTMEIRQRADGKLVLSGDPVIVRTASGHDNLPRIRDGETVTVPDKVGGHSFSMQPIPLPAPFGDAIIGGAAGVVGMLYVLAEEDGLTDGAVRAAYDALVRAFTDELRRVVRGIAIDPAAPGGGNPLAVSGQVLEAIKARIGREVRRAVLQNTPLLQTIGLINADDTLLTDLEMFSQVDLLALPSRPIGAEDDLGKRGSWRTAGTVTARVPADIRVRRQVTMDLDKLTCVRPNDDLPLGDAPYMWNVFFTIDGSTVTLGEDLKLSGRADVSPTPGSHGNLNASGVTAGEVIQIPDSIGRFSTTLDLIPFPRSLQPTMVGGASGVVGCVSVLLEQDLVAPDAAEAGHRAFNREVERVLNELIPTLGVGKSAPSAGELAAARQRIEKRVREAVLEEGNVLEDVFAGADPDDVIGFEVFLFDHKSLLARPNQAIAASFDVAGRYDLTGTISAVPV